MHVNLINTSQYVQKNLKYKNSFANVSDHLTISLTSKLFPFLLRLRMSGNPFQSPLDRWRNRWWSGSDRQMRP